MAIYHLNARGIAPARGSSSIASAAYQSGEAIRDERTGELCKYARAERIVDSGIELPAGVSELDRARLWNMAEAAYAGGNELTAKRYEFALPRELSREDQRACVVEFCKLFPDRACDWAIHDSGDGNPHAHVLVSALPLGKDGFERPKAKKSAKIYLCRDKNGDDVLVAAADWKSAKADGLEKVYNFKDGRRLSMSQAEAEGLTKADRKTKTPVAMTKKVEGGRAFDAEKADLKRIRAEWARIANVHLADLAKRTGGERVAIDHRSFAERAEATRGVEVKAEKEELQHELESVVRVYTTKNGVIDERVPTVLRPVEQKDTGVELLPKYGPTDIKLDHAPTVHEGPHRAPERVAENIRRRGLNAAVDRAAKALNNLVSRASAWWHKKTDVLTKRRGAFISRHTGLMRSTAAKKRGMAVERALAADRAADLAIAREVEAAIQGVFSRRSENHFADLNAVLAKRGIDMEFTAGNKDLEFIANGRAVTGERMGRPLVQLMAMSRAAGRPVTAAQLRAMTDAERAKAAHEAERKAVRVERPKAAEIVVEIDNGLGIHH